MDFQAHIIALKASDNGSNLTSAAIVDAIQYATMMKGRGVNIVALNASYGGGSSSSTEISAMQAAGNAGIVFVVAAGNNTNNNDASPTYPASYRLTKDKSSLPPPIKTTPSPFYQFLVHHRGSGRARREHPASSPPKQASPAPFRPSSSQTN